MQDVHAYSFRGHCLRLARAMLAACAIREGEAPAEPGLVARQEPRPPEKAVKPCVGEIARWIAKKAWQPLPGCKGTCKHLPTTSLPHPRPRKAPLPKARPQFLRGLLPIPGETVAGHLQSG